MAQGSAYKIIRINANDPLLAGVKAYMRTAMGPEATWQKAVEELLVLGVATIKDDASIMIARARAYREASYLVRTRLAATLREVAAELEAGRPVQTGAEVTLP